MSAPDRRAVLVEALAQQRRAWEARTLVRELYGEWHPMAVERLSPRPGVVVELGAGVGALKEHHPAVLATDVEATPWADEVVYAEAMDFEDGSVASLVMFDVLHHLPPARALLRRGGARPGGRGRVVAVEPYRSPDSYPAYRWLHFEGADLRADPFGEAPVSGPTPLDANNALATLLFWRGLGAFRRRHPSLAVVERRRFAPLLYPLSGGLTGRPLIPRAVAPGVRAVERALAPLAGLLAFRCLIVLEKSRR